jgi:tetratricopeptide (TPR) repeat protein
MRKGRSQRKSRGSLPPLSTRPHASTGAEASPPRSRGPQVVIGITSPSSIRVEDPAEAREALAQEAPSPAARAPQQASRGLELVREIERLEIVSEPALTLAEPEPEPAMERDVERAIESESDPFARALTQETPPPPHVGALVTPEEISIPPMGDLAVEPIAERFFSEGELVAHGESEEERRQRFSRYVRWAVGGAAVVCLAALARTALMPHRAPTATAATQALVAPEPAVAPPTVAAAAAAAPAEAKVDVPVSMRPEEPKAAEPEAPEAVAAAEPAKAAEPAQAAEPAKAEEPKAPAVAPGDKTALEEKVTSRKNLERGKLAEAIEAGERSVALDPTDGEAWLLLGASYQEKGNRAEARRCYASCLKEGKRGPLGECRAMIR